MTEQTLRPYSPTWRDKLGSYLYDMTSKSPEARNFVGGLVGSRGLGTTGMSVADATPIGMGLQFQEAAQNGDTKGMALAAIPMPMKAGAGMVKRAAEEVAPAVERGIVAYHGSPHSFDRFDMSKIGTGEGAQAYGHGLYFADSEDVAKSYRDALAGGSQRFVGDEPYRSQDPVHLAASLRTTYAPHGGDKRILEILQDDVANMNLDEKSRDTYQKTIDLIKGGAQTPEFSTKPSGSMYQVRINADPEHFLDWDKPLSKQPVIADKMNSAVRLTQSERERLPARSILELIGDQQTASQKLNQAGIPGIKYLDQGSRSAGEGSRNYVVFDDNLVEILKKYGLVGLLGGGAGLGMMQPEDAQAQTR